MKEIDLIEAAETLKRSHDAISEEASRLYGVSAGIGQIGSTLWSVASQLEVVLNAVEKHEPKLLRPASIAAGRAQVMIAKRAARAAGYGRADKDRALDGVEVYP